MVDQDLAKCRRCDESCSIVRRCCSNVGSALQKLIMYDLSRRFGKCDRDSYECKQRLTKPTSAHKYYLWMMPEASTCIILEATAVRLRYIVCQHSCRARVENGFQAETAPPGKQSSMLSLCSEIGAARGRRCATPDGCRATPKRLGEPPPLTRAAASASAPVRPSWPPASPFWLQQTRLR